MKALLLVVVLGLISCAPSSGGEKYQIKTTKQQISEALSNFRRSDYDFLSLLIINREGEVVRVKKLASKLDDSAKDSTVIRGLYKFKFARAEDAESDYREFILPYRASVNSRRDGRASCRERV